MMPTLVTRLMVFGCLLSAASYAYTSAMAFYSGNFDKGSLHLSMVSLFMVCGYLTGTKK